MVEKIKKVLKKTIKFALIICSILVGIVLLKGIKVDDLKEKFKNL